MTRPRPAPAPPPPRLTGINWDGSAYCFNCISLIFGAEIFTRPPAPPLSPIFGGVYVCARCDFDAVAGWYDGPRPGPGPRPAPPPAPRDIKPSRMTPAPGPGPVMMQFMALAARAAAPPPARLQITGTATPPRPARPPTLRGGWLVAGWKDERISAVKDLPPTPPAPAEIEPARPGDEPRAGWGYHNWTPAELAWLKRWKQEQDAGLAAFMKETRGPAEYKGGK